MSRLYSNFTATHSALAAPHRAASEADRRGRDALSHFINPGSHNETAGT
jgi:hypothetical protein